MSGNDSENLPDLQDDVDPDIRDFVRRTGEDYLRLGRGRVLTPLEARQVAEEVRRPWRTGGPEMASTRELRVGRSKVPVRIHRPTKDRLLPALVYIHGGGWTTFSLNTHDRLMREYAMRGGYAVVGVDYSLSPEVRFPHALGEIAEVLSWLREEGAEAGADASRLAIGGDSAGANLSVASMIRARDRGEPLVDAMLLNYGAFDRHERPSYGRYGDERYMLTHPEMEMFWDNYLGPNALPDPLAMPLRGELHGLPPAYLCVAQCDILLDENLEMAQRLRDAGVDTTLAVYEGATHSFLEAVSISPLAERALEEASAWLKERLA